MHEFQDIRFLKKEMKNRREACKSMRAGKTSRVTAMNRSTVFGHRCKDSAVITD